MKRRKTRSRKEWKRIIEKQAASGLSARAYCRRESLNSHSFYQWRSFFRNESSDKKNENNQDDAMFINMGNLEELASVPMESTKSLTVIVDLGEGQQLTLKKSF